MPQLCSSSHILQVRVRGTWYRTSTYALEPWLYCSITYGRHPTSHTVVHTRAPYIRSLNTVRLSPASWYISHLVYLYPSQELSVLGHYLPQYTGLGSTWYISPGWGRSKGFQHTRVLVIHVRPSKTPHNATETHRNVFDTFPTRAHEKRENKYSSIPNAPL